MRQITPKVKKEVEERPDVCERNTIFHDHECSGRITWEHALMYAGKQVNDAKAIVKLCECSHAVDHFQDGGCMNKEINQLIALSRFTEEDFDRYPNAKKEWKQKLSYFEFKYLKKIDLFNRSKMIPI